MSPDDSGGAAWEALRADLVAGVSAALPPGALERLFRDCQPAPPPGSGETRADLAKLRAGRPADEAAHARIAFALDAARDGGFLKAFVFEISQRVSVSPRFVALARDLHDPAKAEDRVRMEALSDVFVGFDEPDQIIHGMQLGRANTCLVEVSGDAGTRSGTGFLIAPHLVLTTFHTFEGSGCLMSEPDPAGGPPRWRAAPGGRGKVRAVFNNFRDFARGAPALRRGRPAPLAEDWLVSASGSDRIGPGHLDYAILKLAASPPGFPHGFEIAAPSFPANARDRARIHLFQHPDAAPLRVAAGRASRADPDLARIGHDANSLPGSSGGACTDRAFRVFAMHQGAATEAGDGALAAALDNCANVGVPVQAILRHAGDLPPAEIAASQALHVATPRGRRPLLGRDAAKAWVAEAMRGGGARLLVVTGAPGVGKSFTARILEELLPDEGHEIRTLGVQDRYHAMTPLALAAKLLDATPEAAGLPARGANETAADWARGPLLDAFRRAMRARLEIPAPGGSVRRRTLWLALDDLEKGTVSEAEGLRDFLFALYREAAHGDGDWLRVVLLGYQGDPGALPYERTVQEPLYDVERSEMLRWLEQFDAALDRPDDPARSAKRVATVQSIMGILQHFPQGMARVGPVADLLGNTVLNYAGPEE